MNFREVYKHLHHLKQSIWGLDDTLEIAMDKKKYFVDDARQAWRDIAMDISNARENGEDISTLDYVYEIDDIISDSCKEIRDSINKILNDKSLELTNSIFNKLCEALSIADDYEVREVSLIQSHRDNLERIKAIDFGERIDLTGATSDLRCDLIKSFKKQLKSLFRGVQKEVRGLNTEDYYKKYLKEKK